MDSTLIVRLLLPDNEESMWSAVYELFTPVTRPGIKSISPTMVGDRFVGDLYDAWRRLYFNDPLIALRQQMQHCIDDKSAYHAKTLVFVRSSGMGKSRLADPMIINFIPCENKG
ncbi:MAG: hypothetical protein M1840_000778 [Geoglossum simile]|nr:MAG: hypothetical protein M1840_000778 [Geoglossum simile]